MASFPQLTPPLKARGRYKLREPFQAAADIDYTCIAIRTFQDLYREGTNPYTQVYVPAGLTDGMLVGDQTFNFANEEILGVNIITLVDDKGRSILVPDNYIVSFPYTSSINYLEFLLSASLGPLPEDIDLSLATQAVKDAIATQFGINSHVTVHTLPTTTNPTYEEHLAMEAARTAAMTLNSTSADTINRLTADLALRDQTIATLTKILVDNNLIPANQ